jgi:hypothetical protein
MKKRLLEWVMKLWIKQLNKSDPNWIAKRDVKKLYESLGSGVEEAVERLMVDYLRTLENEYPMVIKMQFSGNIINYVRTDEFDEDLQEEIKEFLLKRRPYTQSSVSSRGGLTWTDTIRDRQGEDYPAPTVKIVNTKKGVTIN